MDFVAETMEEWISCGIVTKVSEKPLCVSPLSVVEKVDSERKTKRRLCWDGSRHVNTFLEKQTVTLAHLQRALEVTEQNDFQTVYDLKSAYFHIKIEESQKRFLGASYQDKEGKTCYIVFNYLPFG